MTYTAPARWELGSDFDWQSIRSASGEGPQDLPWMQPGEEATYVESGRQALGLVSEVLSARGYTALLMPDHFCDSMVAPFLRSGWKVDFYPVSRDWQCVPPGQPVAEPDRTLILSMSFFGVPESTEWIEFLSAETFRGAMVLSDESHRVLSRGLAQADIRVASLRKMLPLADGAFLVGLETDGLPNGRQAEARSRAMRKKSQFLSGNASANHRADFAAAEHMTESDLAPARMSDESRALLGSFDYAGLRESRILNHAALRAGLEDSGFAVSTSAAAVASHCVIMGNRIQELRAQLVRNRIYCPVHWPPPSSVLPLWDDWRADILSLPIDHRYQADDMSSLVDEIRAFESGADGAC